MAWHEWTVIDNTALMDVQWFTWHYENCEYLWNARFAYPYAPQPTARILRDTRYVMTQFPFPNLINNIELNIASLKAAWPWLPELYEDTRTWKGEYQDSPKLDYQDVNRWFRSLELLKAVLDSAENQLRIAPWPIANDEDNARQIIRRA